MIHRTLIVSCLIAAISGLNTMGNSLDNSTYSNTGDVRSTHLSLDFAVDFDNKLFDGMVTHEMVVLADKVNRIWMDKVGMDIHRVEYK